MPPGRTGPRWSWPQGRARLPGATRRDGSVPVVDAAAALAGGEAALPEGPVVVHDPVGGPVAVGVAEWLAAVGRDVALVTPDQIAGTLLSLSGDLADANTRLQRAGVRRELRAVVRRIAGGPGPRRRRLDRARGATWPPPSWSTAATACPTRRSTTSGPGTLRAGDCVAPRTVLEAVLEGRRRALEISGAVPAGRIPTTTGADTVTDHRRPAPSNDRTRGRVAGKGRPGHRGGPGPGTQPRRATGRRGRRHHRRRHLRAGRPRGVRHGHARRTSPPRPAWSRRPAPGW